MLIDGCITKVFNGARADWFSGVVKMDGVEYRVAGKVRRHPYAGMKLRGEGHPFYHEKFGLQYQPDDENGYFVEVTDKKSYMALMLSGEFLHVDRKTALRVWDEAGCKVDNIIDMLLNNPEALSVPCSLSEDQVTDFFTALVLTNLQVRLVQMFPSLTLIAAKRLVEHSRRDLDSIIQELRNNPYHLYGVPGVSFEILDRVNIVDNGVRLDNPYRMYYVIAYKLKTVFMKKYSATYLNLSNNIECYQADGNTNSYNYDYRYRDGSFLYMLLTDKKIPMPAGFDEVALRKLFVQFQSPSFNRESMGLGLTFSTAEVSYEVNGQEVKVKENHVYYSDLYHSQSAIVDVIKDVCRINSDTSLFYNIMHRTFENYKATHRFRLSSEQLGAIENVFSNKMSILTGGPGCGKSYTLTGLIPIWESINGKGTVMCIGPTGRSVKRMADIMAAAEGCSDNTDSQTAARCLIANGYSFSHYDYVDAAEAIKRVMLHPGLDSKEFHLDGKSLVIIDECSMMDFTVTGNLLKLLENATILLIGDPDQLPPVGCGHFFKELVDSGIVPVTTLTVCNRTDDMTIIEASRAIMNGTFTRKYYRGGFMFMPRTHDVDTVEQVFTLYQSYVSKDGECDPSEVLVMSPEHRGTAGVDNLNVIFREYQNPLSYSVMNPVPDPNFRDYKFFQHKGCSCEGFLYDVKYRSDKDDEDGDNNTNIDANADINTDVNTDADANVNSNTNANNANNNKPKPKTKKDYVRIGDRVMVSANQSDAEVWIYENHDPDDEFLKFNHGLYNGDLGTVKRYYPASTAEPNHLAYIMIQMDDGGCFYVASDEFNEKRMFEPGYAFTIHKCQGCEAKHVLLCIPQRCGLYCSPTNPFFTRNMLYTACTRAKESVTIIGGERALNHAIDTPAYYHNLELQRFLKD